jgi:hypothetical protein
MFRALMAIMTLQMMTPRSLLKNQNGGQLEKNHCNCQSLFRTFLEPPAQFFSV